MATAGRATLAASSASTSSNHGLINSSGSYSGSSSARSSNSGAISFSAGYSSSSSSSSSNSTNSSRVKFQSLKVADAAQWAPQLVDVKQQQQLLTNVCEAALLLHETRAAG
jgi:hypothetical protein